MIALLVLVWCQVLLANSCDNYYEVTESSARTCYNDLTIGLGANDRMSIESATCVSDSDIQLSWMKSGDVEEMWLYLRCELTNGSTVFIPGLNKLTDYHNSPNSGNLQLSYPSLPLNVKHCYIFGCWLYLYVSYCDSGHFIYNHPLTCRSPPMPSPSLSIASSAVFTNSPLPSISFMDDSIISSPLLSAYITESISTTTTISTASDDVTTTLTRKSLQTSTASTTTITTASSTSVSTSLAIPTTSNPPFTDNQLMVILIIGLVIAIATSGLVICAFIFVVFMVMYRRKKESQIPDIINEIIDRDLARLENKNSKSLNPPPRPFTQPRPMTNPLPVPPMISRNSSMGDDSVFGETIETIPVKGEKKIRDSGFDEHSPKSNNSKDDLTANSSNLLRPAEMGPPTVNNTQVKESDTSGESSNNGYVPGVQVVQPVNNNIGGNRRIAPIESHDDGDYIQFSDM